jgi:hypothetical protein
MEQQPGSFFVLGIAYVPDSSAALHALPTLELEQNTERKVRKRQQKSSRTVTNHNSN